MDRLPGSTSEGCFGSGKRKYSLALIMARLAKGVETSISMAFLVICAEKIWWLLRIFCHYSAWFNGGYGWVSFWIALREVCGVEIAALLLGR